MINRIGCTGLFFLTLLFSLSTPAEEPRVMTPDSATETEPRQEHVADRHAVSVDFTVLREGGSMVAQPGTGHHLTFVTVDVEERGDKAFAWRGEVYDGNGEKGIATLTVQNHRIRGRLELDGQRYLFFTDSDGQTWMDRLDPEAIPHSHPEGGPLRAPESSDEESSQTMTLSSQEQPPRSQSHNEDEGDGAEVDVLLFYSQASIDRYSDEQDLRLAIRNAVDATNTALMNSELSSRVRLLGIYRWDEFDENDTEGMDEGLEEFTHDDWVEGLSELHSADLSALIADYDDFCGLAWLLTQYRSSWDFSFSVTAANQSCLGGQTLAHELGHNMGLRHNPDDANNKENSIEDFAFGHFRDDEFQTIMTQNGACDTPPVTFCRRIDNFSNPEVDDEVSGHPTGVHDERENARVLRLSMPHVETWREPPLTLAEALGDAESDYRTSGDGVWTVQDEVQFEGQPTAISPPVFGEEESRLALVHRNAGEFTVSFRSRSFESGAQGVLEVRTEDELLKELNELTTQWATFEVDVPEEAEELRWVWRADSEADANEVGQALLSLETIRLQGEVHNANGLGVADVRLEATSDSSGDVVLGTTTTAADGSFGFEVLVNDNNPPEHLFASGAGVIPEDFSLNDVNCDTGCNLALEGETRTMAGTASGADPGQTITVTLSAVGSSDTRQRSASANDEGAIDFSFEGDALIHWELEADASGFAPAVITRDELDVREGDALDLSLHLEDPAASDSSGSSSTLGCSLGGSDVRDPAFPLMLTLALLGLLYRRHETMARS